jgi:hypothetical protein
MRTAVPLACPFPTAEHQRRRPLQIQTFTVRKPRKRER